MIAAVSLIWAVLMVLVLWAWHDDRRDLMRRNEDLTDTLLRYQGKQEVFHPGKARTLKKGAGWWDKKSIPPAEPTPPAKEN